MIVVDTNVIAYLLIENERTPVCRKVLAKDSEWSAPFLWRSEFRNVLATHIRLAGMTLEGGVSRLHMASKLLATREFSVSSEDVLLLTQDKIISAYDAEYICLAMGLKTVLITTDKKLLKTFVKTAISPEQFVTY